MRYFIRHQTKINKSKGQESLGNLSRNTALYMKKILNPTKHVNLDLNDVDHVSSKVSRFVYVFEDNEAVNKMIIKGRSPTMRRVSRTHRVAQDWLFDRINLDSEIQIWYIDTKHQLADILTKGIFTRDDWDNLLHLFNISSLCCAQNFSLNSCSRTMAKRTKRTRRRRQDCGKIEAHGDELDFNCLDKFLIREPSDCAEKPGDTQSIYRET